jgi:hypothetical protein
MKKKPPAVARIDQQQTLRQQLCDRFGELKRQEALFSPVKAELESIRAQILSWYPDLLPGESIIVTDGLIYDIPISECGFEREFTSMPRFFNRLGKTTFLRLCRFPLAAFDQLTHLDPELSAFIKKVRTGPRTVKAVARSPLSASEAA